ncbi:MAG: aminoacyl-tRNA hydrolase [Candidatus Aenigmarchaeota archaeon]|nr:aminoacyl-tRNA hydrolase [Candidatus Aenigmarchaeota archaeon]
MDIGMGKGKIIIHAIHAAIGAMRLIDDEIVKKWEDEGAKKVVLKVRDLKELLAVQKRVKEEKIPSYLVKDAGLTQLKAGTITALGIGPYEEKKIDKITGKLKLL